MTTSTLSPSARALALVLARFGGAAHFARELGCDESAVRAWARGRRTPNEAWRDRMAKLDERLRADGWDLDASDPSDPDASPDAPDEAAGSAVGGDDGGEARLLEVIRQCDELFAEARKPGAHASVRDRTAILSAKASATVRLSRVRGEDAVSLRKILASKEWRKVEATLYAVFEGADPELLKKLAAALRTLEAEA